MAVVQDASLAVGLTALGTSSTSGFTCAAGNAGMLSGTQGIGVTITSVTFDTVGLANLGNISGCILWGLATATAPTTGSSKNHVVNFSSYGQGRKIVGSFNGVDNSATLSAFTGVDTNTGIDGAPTTNSVTCPANGMVYGFNSGGSSTTPTISGAGNFIFGANTNGGGNSIAGGYRSSTGAVAWAQDIGAWNSLGCQINPVAAGGATKLKLNSSLSGLGSGGPFFHDRIA